MLEILLFTLITGASIFGLVLLRLLTNKQLDKMQNVLMDRSETTEEKVQAPSMEKQLVRLAEFTKDLER